MTDKPGVLEQERERQEFWLARELPDPVAVLAEERTTRRLYGPANFRSPKRGVLDQYFAEHPDHEPPDWKEQ